MHAGQLKASLPCAISPICSGWKRSLTSLRAKFYALAITCKRPRFFRSHLDRPLRLRPDGAPPAAATMTAAAAPAVGKKDLACCRREPTARAEEHSPEAACVTCSCRSRRWATSYGK